MKKEDIIKSGLLELYVLDERLSSKDLENIAKCETNQEIQSEIETIVKTNDLLFKSLSKEPGSKNLKSKVLKSVFVHEKTARKTFSLPWKPIAIAAFIIIAFSMVLNIYLWNVNSIKSDQNNSLSASNRNMEETIQNLEDERDQNEVIAQMINQPLTKKIILEGTTISKTSTAVVYWNSKTSEVLLYINQLPEPPENMQYQLWVINDGKPGNAGLVEDPWNINSMLGVSKAEAFALSLEPIGGSASPTVERIYLFGEAS